MLVFENKPGLLIGVDVRLSALTGCLPQYTAAVPTVNSH